MSDIGLKSLSLKRLKSAHIKNTLWDEFDCSCLSPLRTKILLLGNRSVHCTNNGQLLVSKSTYLRISRKASVAIDAGAFLVGFQMRGGRRIPTYDHCTLVVHQGGRIETHGTVQLCAGSCMSISSNAVCRLDDGVILSPNSMISCTHGLSIGSNSMFGWGLTLQDDDLHTIQYATLEEQEMRDKRHCQIQIGSNVWAGHHVTILKGVTIGDNVIIGANSVVTKDIPSGAMVAGNPARVVKQGVRWSW